METNKVIVPPKKLTKEFEALTGINIINPHYWNNDIIQLTRKFTLDLENVCAYLSQKNKKFKSDGNPHPMVKEIENQFGQRAAEIFINLINHNF